MADYDQQISENIKELDKKHQQLADLAEALVLISQNSERNYGISTGFKPQRGIYYIEKGRIKPLADIYPEAESCSLDKIKGFQLITSEENNEAEKLKITYYNNKTIILK
ncbi:hypothetical protein [Halanaerobacter jeridensis]|uniref:Uncharacterized protein n=1 Tax=Halanaerobacter jeridensis TaxID=706427 RepID=A0A938XUE8_9FIRM|nr:hypothetical protein [Halanaerobacter jeridensis]MBM7557710.1 hypothetical protein [Halanaerobacter jeridensis]